MSDCDDDYNSDGDYDMFRDLVERGSCPLDEHPLDRALRTNNIGLRCYYWEMGRTDEGWGSLRQDEQKAFERPPVVQERRVPSGMYYMYSIDGSPTTIDEDTARAHWSCSFQAS